MGTPILAITDGTTKVNLLTKTGAGINTCEYTPSRQIFKNDGIWADSSVSDGRQLQMRKWTNIIDVLSLVISGDSQDSVIENARRLTTLLEKAVQYWTTEWQNEPVWLERRGSNETNTSYTLIHSYKWANDDNPFAPPFYVTEKPFSMKDIDLALEHGPWLANAPGESECVEISNLMLGGITANTADSPTGAGDDCEIHFALDAIFLNPADMRIDDSPVGGGVRYRGVAIPAGSIIIAAYAHFYATEHSVGDITASVWGELNANPAAFTTYANYIGRTKTTNNVLWNMYPWIKGNQYYTPDLKDIIQEIVNLGGWASGQDIVLMYEYSESVQSGAYSEIAMRTHPTLPDPILWIYYTERVISGREATCADEVYVANKDNIASIDTLFAYEANLARFINLVGLATPFDLFPNPIGINDILYIGSTIDPFCSVVFDIGTIGDTTITWEYWNGAWVGLTVVTDRVGLDDFLAPGVGAIIWSQPADWAKTPINAVNAYWVRARVTNAATITPTQQNRDIYTVISSSINVANDEVDGDITAIAKINTVTVDTTRGEVEKLIMGLRSSNRGENFRQHINTDGQNNADITVAVHDVTAIQAYVDAPTGSVLRTAWAGNQVMTLEFDFTFAVPLAQEYYGRYRAFMRGIDYSSSINDGDIKSYLNISMGSSRASKIASNIGIGNDWYYFDYGIIIIPPAILPEIYQGSVLIKVYASNDAGAIDFDWVDLILVPVDEYALELRQDADAISNLHDITVADSISYIGKSNVFSVLQSETDTEIKDIPTVISPGPIQLQANVEQEIYFFVPDASKYEWLGRIQIWDNERYLTLRGDS